MTNTGNEKTELAQRYVDILTNSGFKALFGDINNKEVVISIINVLLPAHRRVTDIEYMPTEHQGQLREINKEYHYDFMCRDESGTVFIVELQCYQEDDWFKRCVSYACRSYDRQNRRGGNYNVAPVYLIGLMGIEIEHPDKKFWKDRYISEYTFREKESHDLLGETIVIIFAEMANFSKIIEECTSETDKMLYLLKNIGKMANQPSWLQQEVYSRIFRACEIAEFSEDKRIQYEKDMYDEKRLNGEMSAARRIGYENGHKEGLKNGHEEGLKQGLEQGRRQGLEQGLEQGREQAKIEMAKNLKALGVSLDIISQSTGIGIDVIEKL
jgi:predicted transposase/invertase (TIGR01784 family)